MRGFESPTPHLLLIRAAFEGLCGMTAVIIPRKYLLKSLQELQLLGSDCQVGVRVPKSIDESYWA